MSRKKRVKASSHGSSTNLGHDKSEKQIVNKMNIKLHTPTTLKAGSGMSSARQFMLSLIATTVSIILTFGTAALIDYYKKQASKKEMVMMVISDFDNTISFLERVDSGLIECRRLQREVALHPESFDSLKQKFPPTMLWVTEKYLETTEKIFSTSIETFSTIGDVNFVNDVSSFYLARQQIKEMVLDEIKKEVEDGKLVESLSSLISINFPEYVMDIESSLSELRMIRDKCMMRMDVSEIDLSEFKEQNKYVSVSQDNDTIVGKLLQEFKSYNAVLNQTREKLKD